MRELAAAVEASGFGAWARTDVWAYPAANVVHVLAAALLIGAVLAIDLRWLGRLRAAPADAVARVFEPIAFTSLGLLVLSGSVLFASDARALVGNGAFWIKVGLIAAAGVNFALSRRLRPDGGGAAAVALASLTAWLGVAAFGRLIAYV